MRDITGDLQERAYYCEEQIRSIYAHFDKMVQQLQSERDMRVADLKSGLVTIEKLLQFEDRFMENVVPLSNPQTPILSLADRLKAANA